jgi:SAM-dependent methyltransferase
MRGVEEVDKGNDRRANPDIKAASLEGQLLSGDARSRVNRWRQLRRRGPRPTRRDKILSGLDLARMAGLEIGPLDRPLVRKSDGDVLYVDHADAAYLRDRHKNNPQVNIDNIVEIDGFWGEKTLAEAIGPEKKLDYVVASHVVEHVPDLISWLQETYAVLKPDGSLRLAVPDKRFTFDYDRDPSKPCDVLDAYIRKARAPLPRMVLDFCLAARHVDAAQAWQGPLDQSKIERFFTDPSALSLAKEALETGAYHDVHCWVFTPISFAQLMFKLGELALLSFRCQDITNTKKKHDEFYVIMSPESQQDKVIETWRQASNFLAASSSGNRLISRISRALSGIIGGVNMCMR